MIKALTTGSAAVLVALLLGGAAQAQTAPAPKAPAMKMTQAECTSLWNRLDTAKSGNVTQAQATAYVTDFSAVDSNKDGKLSQAEFQAGCDKGLVHSSATTGPGSGNAGSKK
jgi:hypothetical protein